MRSPLIAATAIMLAATAYGADGITAVRDSNGRIVFVNAEKPAQATVVAPSGEQCATPSAARGYVYWSVTQRRWKRVPQPTAAQVRSACSAAKEVEARLAAPAPGKKVATELSVGRPAWTSAAVDTLIEETAKRHDVDPNLVRAMIKAESNFNARAVSRKGAIGLMQLMPATARELKVNPYDPAQNLDGGVRHMKQLLERNGGDVALSLAAYNAGQGAVERHGGVPNYKETKSYVRKITDMYADPGTAGRTKIRESKDADGHRVYTND